MNIERPKIRLLTYLGIFLLAFVPRYLIIINNEEFNKHTDLQLYINAGLLIVNHINPYDFNDKVAERQKLRLNPILNESWLMESQEKWNFYTSGNLPASQLYFGLVEFLAHSDPVNYRIIFAIVDSLLSVIIFLFVTRFWIINSSSLKVGFGIFLGALNPVLLYWGALIPQDKGLQILLMMATVFFAIKRNIFWSAVFMGIAVCFKGLGLFLVPYCIYLICDSPTSIKGYLKAPNLKKTISYGLISFITFAVLFVPFLPEVIGMMSVRLSSNLLQSPQHSSIWTIPYELWPSAWRHTKTLFIVGFTVLVTYGSVTKKLDVGIVTACILVFFVDISLNMGSLDRMNMGFLVAILILGSSKFANHTQTLGIIYILLGTLAFFVFTQKLYLPGQTEKFDAEFSLYIVILLTVLLLYTVFKPGALLRWSGFIAIGISVILIIWNVKTTSDESFVRRVFSEVGMGIKRPEEVKFTSSQKKIAQFLILAEPEYYNELQKILVFGIPEANQMVDLIQRVGLGKINPDSVTLSINQKKIIDSIISLNPKDYNLAQRSLASMDYVIFDPEYVLKVLHEVGMGRLHPDSVRLSTAQQIILDSIISRNQENYNPIQKSLGSHQQKDSIN